MMRIALTGSNGLVGRELRSQLLSRENTVFQLIREGASHPMRRKTDVLWSPKTGAVETEKIEGIHAAVHLAGENLASGRWNKARKEAFRRSRVDGTHHFAKALASLSRKPDVLVSASAIGFYGDRGDEVMVEGSEAGEGYLCDMCKEWEAATQVAEDAGIRVVHLRVGLVLSPEGGALKKILPLFRKGLGGKLGSGMQYMSWISLPDLVSAIIHCIGMPSLSGAVNGVSVNAVTNAEFTKVLGKVLKRPTVLGVPAFGLRLAVGEMADALLLSSTRVLPQKLMDSGFRFAHEQLEAGLRGVLPEKLVRG